MTAPSPIATLEMMVAAALMSTLLLVSGVVNAEERKTEVAIVAGGCFWCVESDFDKVPGIIETVSGYTGGTVENPSYRQVTSGGTGHREAVQITFDPSVLSYEQFLEIFWRTVDPTDDGGQFCDRGHSYTTAIYATSDEQQRLAEASKTTLNAQRAPAKPLITPILAATPFYPAEDYHQDYHEKNPLKYSFYRYRCGRDARVRDVWGNEAYRGVPTS